MQEHIQISEAELEVMKVLWQQSEATSGQVIDGLKDKTAWKSKTIQTLLSRLVAKGAVSTQQINGKNFIYRPIIKEDQYKMEATSHFLDRLYNGSLNILVSNFVKQKKLSKTEIEQLRQILDEEEQ